MEWFRATNHLAIAKCDKSLIVAFSSTNLWEIYFDYKYVPVPENIFRFTDIIRHAENLYEESNYNPSLEERLEWWEQKEERERSLIREIENDLGGLS